MNLTLPSTAMTPLRSLALCLSLLGPMALADPGSAPSGLMCNLLADPARTLITDPKPKFTWIVNATVPNAVQTAYELRVAPSAADLDNETACLWATGKVASDQSTAVAYAGRPLESNRAYAWKVRAWVNGGAEAWSAPQEFKVGNLAAPRAGEDRFTVDRYPLAQTPISPRTIVELEKGHYFIDFGRDAYADLKLTLNSPEAGRKIIVHLGEALEKPNLIHRKPGGSIRYHRVEMALKEGANEYVVPLTPKDARKMPPEIGPVMPFRYVEVENAPALDAKSITQIAVHYPFDDKAARFESSDKTLNDVWELCRYSIKATSFCGLYVDGDRERLPYEADAYINQLGHYCVDREYTLARYSHEHLIQHATWPTEWPLHTVFIAWADYLYTGDATSAAAFYDDLKAKTLYKLARADGLISTVQPKVSKEFLKTVHESRLTDIVDWPLAERDGYEFKPINTVVNAFHYRALVLMSQLAVATHHPDDARLFQQSAAKVAAAFNEKLFDEKTGLYVDGEGSTHSSLHANMCAMAFDLVPVTRKFTVAAFIRGKGMACSVYGAQYLMEALYRAGDAEQALSLLTSRTDRSWAHMLYDVGSTITLEAWDNKYKPNQDWNHAWGAAPANVIPRLLMGVEPIEPGFRKLRIRPQPGGLASAKLDLPTIRGPVHVEFQSAVKLLDLSVTLPANTAAEVWLPRLGSDDDTISLDGQQKTLRRDGTFLVLDSLGSGPHRLTRSVR